MSKWKHLLAAPAAVLAVAMLAGPAANAADEGHPEFERLADPVKVIVKETSAQLGELEAICEMERPVRSKEINRIAVELKDGGKIAGLGFYALDVENYYRNRCRDL